jgi:hypothetical protein
MSSLASASRRSVRRTRHATVPRYFDDALQDPSKIGTIHFNLEGLIQDVDAILKHDGRVGGLA